MSFLERSSVKDEAKLIASEVFSGIELASQIGRLEKPLLLFSLAVATRPSVPVLGDKFIELMDQSVLNTPFYRFLKGVNQEKNR